MTKYGPYPKASQSGWVFHSTDADGWKMIRSQKVWVFKADKPKGGRPFGAYFTRLLPDDNKFAAGTRVPVDKRDYVFAFEGEDGLEPVKGGKGDYNLLTDSDYEVPPDRQRYEGRLKDLP
jgi:hypothetical protein